MRNSYSVAGNLLERLLLPKPITLLGVVFVGARGGLTLWALELFIVHADVERLRLLLPGLLAASDRQLFFGQEDIAYQMDRIALLEGTFLYLTSEGSLESAAFGAAACLRCDASQQVFPAATGTLVTRIRGLDDPVF